jgi:hypothetical protein
MWNCAVLATYVKHVNLFELILLKRNLKLVNCCYQNSNTTHNQPWELNGQDVPTNRVHLHTEEFR